MANTLSNGYILPETGDRGNVWFPAIESNIQRLNDHTHNGFDSSKLDAQSVNALYQDIVPASWSLQGNGLYRAAVTMPGSLLWATSNVSLRANGKALYADIQNITPNTFYVYVNDSSLTVTVLFS